MTRLEFLMQRWYEVDRARYGKLAEIRAITGDDSWMRHRSIPGSAIPVIAQWLGHCRVLAILNADIATERRQPPSEMILQ